MARSETETREAGDLSVPHRSLHRPDRSKHRGEASRRWALVFALLLGVGCSGRATDALDAFNQGDYELARRLWQPSAEQGDADAQNYLGILYHLGLGMDKDYRKGAEWYRRAAESGNAYAQRNLGTMYEFGLGVAQDEMQAYAWYYESALAGNKKARYYLAAMNTKLLPNQIVRARKLLRNMQQKKRRSEATK